MSADQCPPLPDFTSTAGPMVLGHMVSYLAFGIFLVQLYMYHTCFGNSDRWWIRTLVWSLLLVEIVFQVLETYEAWWTLGTGWGKIDHLLVFTKAFDVSPVLAGIATSMVQGFYAWRISVLGKHFLIPSFICVASVAQLITTIVLAIRVSSPVATRAVLVESRNLITAWASTSVSTDIVITVVMVFYMLRERRQSTYKQTINRIDNVIKYIVETGAITSGFFTVELILFLVFPNSNYHYLMFYCLGKVYANTLLATLNSRMTFLRSAEQLAHTDTELMIRTRNTMWSDQLNSNNQSNKSDGTVAVHVQQQSMTLKDGSESMDRIKRFNTSGSQAYVDLQTAKENA